MKDFFIGLCCKREKVTGLNIIVLGYALIHYLLIAEKISAAFAEFCANYSEGPPICHEKQHISN